MFRVWDAPIARPTRDIDLLGRSSNTIETVVAAVDEVCRLEVEPDGTIFDAKSLEAERIKEDADYEGVRIKFFGRLGNARVRMQLDAGFGDAVVPGPVPIEYPPLLDMPAPWLNTYPAETVVAEKLEVMVHLGIANSRMKDLYDIWLLAGQFDFDGGRPARAIIETFVRRGAVMTASPVALTGTFAGDAKIQALWRALLRRSRLDGAPETLRDVVAAVSIFLIPVASACADGKAFTIGTRSSRRGATACGREARARWPSLAP